MINRARLRRWHIWLGWLIGIPIPIIILLYLFVFR